MTEELEFGLSRFILSSLRSTLAKYGDIERACIFGSRARGDFKDYSDIDIAIFAPEMSSQEFANLCMEIDALPIVFSIDIVKFENISDPEFKNMILRDGKVIFSQSEKL